MLEAPTPTSRNAEIAAMNERHLRIARFVQAKALADLKTTTFKSPTRARRAFTFAKRLKRDATCGLVEVE